MYSRKTPPDFRFLFIRHAEAESSKQPELIGGGKDDTSLTELGRRQAQALGKKCIRDNTRFDRLYVTPHSRGQDTATHMLAAMSSLDGEWYKKWHTTENHQVIRTTPQIGEIRRGEWQGQKRDAVMNAQIQLYQSKMAREFCYPGGESQRMVAMRALNWLMTDIILNLEFADYPKPVTIGIITHGVIIKTLLVDLCGLDTNIHHKIPLANCGITELTFKIPSAETTQLGIPESELGWTLITINDDSVKYFLEPEYRSGTIPAILQPKKK
jgi:broad specificity phosphatase PhoE